jgi:aspartate ammonia-lyase
MPLVGSNLVRSSQLLRRTCEALMSRCVRDIEADRERCANYFASSAGLATVLNPLLGYDRVSELVKESLATGESLRALVRRHDLIDDAAFDELLQSSTGPTPDEPALSSGPNGPAATRDPDEAAGAPEPDRPDPAPEPDTHEEPSP